MAQPINAADTPKIPSLPYHSLNTCPTPPCPSDSASSAGCRRFCTPQTSSPAVQGGNCLPTIRTCGHLRDLAKSVTSSAASSKSGKRAAGIKEGTTTKPSLSYCADWGQCRATRAVERADGGRRTDKGFEFVQLGWRKHARRFHLMERGVLVWRKNDFARLKSSGGSATMITNLQTHLFAT